MKMGLEVLTADPNSTNLGSYKNPLPSVLPGWKIKVITGDTSCSSTIGPLEAVKLHCEAGGKKLKPFFFLVAVVCPMLFFCKHVSIVINK